MPEIPSEFYQDKERIKRKKELRTVLPLEKQLEFPTKSSGRIGVPPEEFKKMRGSLEIEDRLFFETAKNISRKKIDEESSEEEKKFFKNLQSEATAKKEKSTPFF